MKSNFLILTIICFISCNEIGDGNPKPISSSINKIMSLGASRVEGERPNFESYRYELWKKLIDNNFTFDFIGTQSDDSKYPSFKGFNFDIDHEGRGGWTSGDILEGLEGWLKQTGSPDFILFSSPGGNDALEGLSYSDAVSNINSIIDIIQNNNPNITIIIEQLAPGHSEIMTSELTFFWESMQKEVLKIANNKSTITSHVIPVDMYTGFDDNLLADDVHYNEEGAKFISNRYFNILKNLLE